MRPPFENPDNFVDMMIPLSRYSVSEYIICGVYFLFQGPTLQYIGQSVNIIARCGDHVRDGKEFDSFTFVRCRRDQLDVLERSCIRLFKPPLNGSKMYADAGYDYDFGNGRGNGVTDLRRHRFQRAIEKSGEPPAFLDRDQVAQMMGFTNHQLKRLIREGGLQLATVKIGHVEKYRRSDVEAAIASVGTAQSINGSNGA